MTTRDAHARSSHFSPVRLTVDAPPSSVGFPTFRLTPDTVLAPLRYSVAALLTNLLTQTRASRTN